MRATVKDQDEVGIIFRVNFWFPLSILWREFG